MTVKIGGVTITAHSMLGDDLLPCYSKQTRTTEYSNMPLNLNDLCAHCLNLDRKGEWESTKNAVSQ